MSRAAGKWVVGLDVGQTTTKMVALEAIRGNAVVRHVAVFQNRDEGILGEEELGAPLGQWLADLGYAETDTVLGIPQYLAIVQLADFPSGVGGKDRLEDMVAYETQHLSGLTDESLVHGFHQLTPFHIYQNPVLIGVCREGVIQNRLNTVSDAHLTVADLGLNGVALANTFFWEQRRKSEKANPGLELLLDIGAESTTCVLIFAGQITNVASFMFGGESFTDALAQHLMISHDEAEKTKLSSRLLASDVASPLTRAAQDFERELRSSILEPWQAQHEKNTGTITEIHLSGGASRLPGFSDFLAKKFACPVTRMQVPVQNEKIEPASFSMAYGLALQGLEPIQEPVSISLAPQEISWATRRRRRLGYLRAAAALLITMMIGWTILSFISIKKETAYAQKEWSRLQESKAMIPALETTQREVMHLQNMLIPFVAYGNRNRIFVHALDILSRYQQPGDWLAYLADEDSYRQGDLEVKPEVSITEKKTDTRTLFGLSTEEKEKKKKAEKATLSSSIRPWRNLIAAGFTRRRERNPLHNIRVTVDDLNTKPDSIFCRVDTLPTGNVVQSAYFIMRPWLEKFRMKPFFIQLPIKQVDYEPEKKP